MSTGNQAWGFDFDDATIVSADYARYRGKRVLQVASDDTARTLTAGDIDWPGERVWLFVEHDATEAAWAQGQSIVLDDTAVGSYRGELTDSVAPSAVAVLGLAQFAWAATVRRFGLIGRTGPFEALTDATLGVYEAAVATNNAAAGNVAGVAFGAATDAHIGIALEGDGGAAVLTAVDLNLE